MVWHGHHSGHIFGRPEHDEEDEAPVDGVQGGLPHDVAAADSLRKKSNNTAGVAKMSSRITPIKLYSHMKNARRIVRVQVSK